MKPARLLLDIDDLNCRWISMRSSFMKTLVGAAVVAGALALAGPAAINPAAAAAPQLKAQTAGSSDATDISARRYHRRYYRYRSYDRYQPFVRPYYYARPYYYRPYPYYAPAPFPFGLGFGPYWW
jgi:hypothetical protein